METFLLAIPLENDVMESVMRIKCNSEVTPQMVMELQDCLQKLFQVCGPCHNVVRDTLQELSRVQCDVATSMALAGTWIHTSSKVYGMRAASVVSALMLTQSIACFNAGCLHCCEKGSQTR